MKIVGRQYEKAQLQKIFQSDRPEFVAVYGRRRVGKTFLVREFFASKKCVFFRSAGIHKGILKKQLAKFKSELETTFYQKRQGTMSDFSNWHDAFQALTDAIDLFAGTQKVVIFLDELPWMATPKSGLLEALDYYWNRYWSEDKRIKLVICGSAASWIIRNVLHDTGGLHNRVTLRLPIEPFTLSETKEYLSAQGVHYNNDQILMTYMCLGGIPFYLNFIEKGLSAIQNINRACFNKRGTLLDEFHLLFASLFKKDGAHEDIITFIASKREGVARNDIETRFSQKGGRLTERLRELEEAGFIRAFVPWKKERGAFYKVIDEYTLFYLTWIAPRATSRISKSINDAYWEVLSHQPAWKAWSGDAFEAVCFKHIEQIEKALRIPESSEVASWRYMPDSPGNGHGAQIDLIFDRPDHVINLCEIKHSTTQFSIDKDYAVHMQNREKIYVATTKAAKQIFHSMVVSSGLKKNKYSEEMMTSVATLADLFKN